MSEGLVMNASVWGSIVDKEQARVDKIQEVYTAKIAEKKVTVPLTTDWAVAAPLTGYCLK